MRVFKEGWQHTSVIDRANVKHILREIEKMERQDWLVDIVCFSPHDSVTAAALSKLSETTLYDYSHKLAEYVRDKHNRDIRRTMVFNRISDEAALAIIAKSSIGNPNDPDKYRLGAVERIQTESILKDIVRNGTYYDAVNAAKEKIANKDFVREYPEPRKGVSDIMNDKEKEINFAAKHIHIESMEASRYSCIYECIYKQKQRGIKHDALQMWAREEYNIDQFGSDSRNSICYFILVYFKKSPLKKYRVWKKSKLVLTQKCNRNLTEIGTVKNDEFNFFADVIGRDIAKKTSDKFFELVDKKQIMRCVGFDYRK